MLDLLLRVVYQIKHRLKRACFFCRGIAQLVEHRSPKPRVVSSNLTAPASKKPSVRAVFYWLLGKLMRTHGEVSSTRRSRARRKYHRSCDDEAAERQRSQLSAPAKGNKGFARNRRSLCFDSKPILEFTQN